MALRSSIWACRSRASREMSSIMTATPCPRCWRISPKTVRDLYLGLRGRLFQQKFNPWHHTGNAMLLISASPLDDMYGQELKFVILAECAGNESCARNWRLGNRKQRQCRKCLLPKFHDSDTLGKAYALIDAVHDFYEHVGIREKNVGSTWLFQLRLMHTVTVSTVLYNSRKLASGYIDPLDDTFLSGGRLMRLLVEDLARSPLGELNRATLQEIPEPPSEPETE
jgi:hypothetical protein